MIFSSPGLRVQSGPCAALFERDVSLADFFFHSDFCFLYDAVSAFPFFNVHFFVVSIVTWIWQGWSYCDGVSHLAERTNTCEY